MFEITSIQYSKNLADFSLSINNMLNFLLSFNVNKFYFDFMYAEIEGKTIRIRKIKSALI